MSRQERVRRERQCKPSYTQEELDQAAIEHAAYEQEMGESYQDSRQSRYEQNQAEWEEWREKRRQERQEEAERYEEIKEERRSAKLNEEDESWHETLRLLARAGGCR